MANVNPQQYAVFHSNTRKDEIYGGQQTDNYNTTSTHQSRNTRRDKHQARTRKRNQPSNFRKLFSYEALIAMAIRRSPTRALALSEIHSFIAEMYPYFKIYPAVLKANINKTLSISTCFAKIKTTTGLPEGQYWMLAEETRPSGIITYREQTHMSIKAKNSSESPLVSGTTRSRTAFSMNSPTAYFQTCASRNDISSIVYSQTKTRLPGYINDTSIYPRIPVITPTEGNQQEHQEEIGIKIGQVFSLSPQSCTALPTVMPSNLPDRKETIERLRKKIIPYHPCTLWTSHATRYSPGQSSFVSEDKERYEDA